VGEGREILGRQGRVEQGTKRARRRAKGKHDHRLSRPRLAARGHAGVHGDRFHRKHPRTKTGTVPTTIENALEAAKIAASTSP